MAPVEETVTVMAVATMAAEDNQEADPDPEVIIHEVKRQCADNV